MTIRRFGPVNDRGLPMDHTVSVHAVPTPRMMAYVLRDCERHGAKVSVASCIRVDAIVEEHNREIAAPTRRTPADRRPLGRRQTRVQVREA